MSNPLLKQLTVGGTTFDVCDPVARAGAGGGAGMSADVIQAILDCFQNVAWANSNGQTYYDALYDALTSEDPTPSAELSSISAVFTQGNNVVYSVDSLDYLKTMLTVTALYSDSSTRTVTGYTLSGTLAAGTSTITVTYGGKTATFTVTVTDDNVVYVLRDHVFSGSTGNAVDTGYALLDTNKAWTLFFDVVTTGQALTNWILFGCQPDSGTGNQIYLVNNGSNSSAAYFRWMANTFTALEITAFGKETSGNYRFLVKHEANSDDVTFMIKEVGGSVLYNQVVSSTFVTGNSTHLLIGGNTGGTRSFTGTVNCRIYEAYTTPSDF